MPRHGEGGPKGFGAQYTSSATSFTNYGSLSLNCDWFTIATIPINSTKNIVAVLTEGYSSSPHTIVLTDIGKEISVTLGGNHAKGIMHSRLVKSGDNILLQAKQTDAANQISVYYYWSTGI